MRIAKTQDNWRKINTIKYKTYVNKIDLKGYNGINDLSINPGIYVICGLNGAGKTTIISAIKDIIGIPRRIQDEIKIGDASISGSVLFNDKVYNCTNEVGDRLEDKGITYDNISFIEYSHAVTMLDFFWKQENIDELIEQNDISQLSHETVKEINYLIGREYTKIQICEVEEIEGIGTIPFFQVDIEGVSYDSRRMGVGEHCLMYLYWMIIKAKEDSIVILEEPESFIGIQSQIHLMNIIAKQSIERKISFIITTHSPFILEKIENTNVSIISRASGLTGISNPTEQISVNEILGGKDNVKGTFFVEDAIAELFLKILLEAEDTYIYRNYTIEVVGSSSQITKALQCPRTNKIKYQFIGIYDEDQKEEVNLEKNNWPCYFLPPQKDVESAMKNIFGGADKVMLLADKVGKKLDEIVLALSQISGEDHHDWLLDFCRVIAIDKHVMLRAMYGIWKGDNLQKLEEFVYELRKICY